jgi:hypothetical protein
LLNVAALILSAHLAAHAEIIDRVMAVVSGRVITLTDVRAALELGLIDSPGAVDRIAAALRQLVIRQLMLDEVNRFAAPEPPEAAMQTRLQTVRRRFSSVEAREAALLGLGITDGHLRDLIRDDLRIELYLNQRFDAPARPTDQEVAQYYRDRLGEFSRDGKPLPEAEARELARLRLHAERRRTMIDDWVGRLRRRAQVSEPYISPAQ